MCRARARVCISESFCEDNKKGGHTPAFFWLKNPAGRRKKGINQSEERVVTPRVFKNLSESLTKTRAG